MLFAQCPFQFRFQFMNHLEMHREKKIGNIFASIGCTIYFFYFRPQNGSL